MLFLTSLCLFGRFSSQNRLRRTDKTRRFQSRNDVQTFDETMGRFGGAISQEKRYVDLCIVMDLITGALYIGMEVVLHMHFRV